MESPSMLAPTANVARPTSPLPFVHRFYILLKAHYFLFFSAFGTVYPILNITLRSRGLSNTELSYINIIIPFLVFFTNPLLGFIADHSRRYLSTFNFVIATATILFTAMFLLPIVKTRHIQADVIYDNKLGNILNFCASQEVATKCASRSECGCSYQANCSAMDSFNHKKHFDFTFLMNSQKIYKKIQGTTDMSELASCGIQYRIPINQAIKNYTKKHRQNSDSSPLAVCEITCSIAHYCHGPRYDNQMRYIFLYSILFILATNFLSNAIPLGASIGFASLPRPELFGQQRVYGTIGFGVTAFLASRIYGIFKTDFVYIIMFCITTVLCMIITSLIPTQSNTTNDESIVQEKEMNGLSVEKEKKKSQSKLSTLLPLLKKLDVIVFLSLTFICGMSYAALDPYLYLYIDEIAVCQSHSIVGWMSLVASIAEVIALFLAAKVLKLLGTNLASIIILLAFTVRLGGYYLIREPYFIIPMEIMHFFNFGILYVLIARKADSIAPSGLAGTLQGIALGVLFGIARGVGLVIASIIYRFSEPRFLFLIGAIFNLIAAIIFSIYFILNRQPSTKPIEKNDVDYDEKAKEEPLLVVSTKNQLDNPINEQ